MVLERVSWHPAASWKEGALRSWTEPAGFEGWLSTHWVDLGSHLCSVASGLLCQRACVCRQLSWPPQLLCCTVWSQERASVSPVIDELAPLCCRRQKELETCVTHLHSLTAPGTRSSVNGWVTARRRKETVGTPAACVLELLGVGGRMNRGQVT